MGVVTVVIRIINDEHWASSFAPKETLLLFRGKMNGTQTLLCREGLPIGL